VGVGGATAARHYRLPLAPTPHQTQPNPAALLPLTPLSLTGSILLARQSSHRSLQNSSSALGPSLSWFGEQAAMWAAGQAAGGVPCSPQHHACLDTLLATPSSTPSKLASEPPNQPTTHRLPATWPRCLLVTLEPLVGL
jgi:hypothetical protein